MRQEAREQGRNVPNQRFTIFNGIIAKRLYVAYVLSVILLMFFIP